ncbi:endonuclease/exonuclease/phosphatase family protein [Streptomyces sp. NPDC020983]|uniref:endonuclease/exonuclease/phosphatase family protein n=1 Tax=Streptomyces sp. NPDC020983 TaxID=3365106 RepID=UPI0037BCF8F6
MRPRAWPAHARRAVRAASRPGPWRRGRVLAGFALALGLLLLLHARIPNGAGGLGSLAETFLPWFGALVPALLAGALWRRSATAVVALLLPAVVWLNLFGGALQDKSRPGGDLTVAEHNVSDANPDPAGTARGLAASGADVVALVELTPQARPAYEQALAATYPYHTVQGTVGLWSRLPLSGTRPIDVKVYGSGPGRGPGGLRGAVHRTPPQDTGTAASTATDATRALRTTVTTPEGPVAVYVAHLGSVRVFPRNGFWTDQRDAGAKALTEAVAAEGDARVVLLGDLNGTVDDRAFSGLTAQLHSAQSAAGMGFGFTWPAKFPVVRIDQILVRGVRADSSWVLPATASDHLPVAARLTL